jgi:cold shock protein
MQAGTVKWFDCKKGFGFVTGPQGEDVFVHFSVIEGDGFRRLDDGEPVEYEFTRGPKGLLATRVRSLAAPKRDEVGFKEPGGDGSAWKEDSGNR